jgi:hypothetical protein
MKIPLGGSTAVWREDNSKPTYRQVILYKIGNGNENATASFPILIVTCRMSLLINIYVHIRSCVYRWHISCSRSLLDNLSLFNMHTALKT